MFLVCKVPEGKQKAKNCTKGHYLTRSNSIHTGILIKPFSVAELCRLYAITDKTLHKWLRPFQEDIGPRLGHLYNVRLVEIIFERLGAPYGGGE